MDCRLGNSVSLSRAPSMGPGERSVMSHYCLPAMCVAVAVCGALRIYQGICVYPFSDGRMRLKVNAEGREECRLYLAKSPCALLSLTAGGNLQQSEDGGVM